MVAVYKGLKVAVCNVDKTEIGLKCQDLKKLIKVYIAFYAGGPTSSRAEMITGQITLRQSITALGKLMSPCFTDPWLTRSVCYRPH